MYSNLTALPSTLRVYLPFLKAVKLTGNPWHCNSSLAWMANWMRSGTVEFFEPVCLSVCLCPHRQYFVILIIDVFLKIR